jgi:mannose-6-phosphate isomerase
MPASLYPLRFEPLVRRYIWGGRRLGTELRKPIGEGSDYAESWELVDRDADQSRVVAGALAGTTLGQLMGERRADLLGSAARPRNDNAADRFPLLVKFLDAQKHLSVQVHPDDAQAARLGLTDFGKTEAWVVLSAEPGSKIFAGLKRGFDRAAFERELTRGTCELCLHHFEPRAGDCVFLPAGTVHALGAGLLVAEIQQSSDTTYRLFDWNRLGPDGRPRELHVEQALEVINFRRGPVDPIHPALTDRPGVSRLVACEQFILDRWEFVERMSAGEDSRCHILIVLAGEIRVERDSAERPLRRGETLLLPAAAGAVRLDPIEAPVVLLDVYLP